MKISVAIQILPTTKEATSESIVAVVDKVIEYIQSENVNYIVSPFETVIELDDFNKAFEILQNCVKLAGENSEQVVCYSKIFYSERGILTIEEKTSKYQG
ncbi:thiamine-binding protein [Peptoniphilus sp. MSJ-1]|uniref:Thiamine-binding protein n=1 Tax=Peptoniphilus ovalis TaxID=2841503 RepID=A0ABS6FF36_9FIRM|nr:thiamine-binding protein [Peptoniphilus ovalis]MBU5668770.1 thiamine-binding protein [Peptoniphilus ovalis]